MAFSPHPFHCFCEVRDSNGTLFMEWLSVAALDLCSVRKDVTDVSEQH